MTSALLEQVVNGLMIGSIYVLVALGMVLIYGVMHVLNFAHGALFMVGGYLCHFFFTRLTGSYVAAVLLSMAALALIGVAIERSVFRPLQGNLRNQVIASLGLILVIENLVIALWGPNALQMKTPATEHLVSVGELRFPLQHLLIIVITAIVVAAMFAFLKWSKFGTALRATSQDRNAAMVVGIPVERVDMASFALGTALAALGGALVAYPVLSAMLGREFPEMPTFGLPCPTTIFTLGLLAFLKWSKFGTALRATSQDRNAAMVVGIPVERVDMASFAIGTALAALGGALVGPLFLVFPLMGDAPMVKGLAGILLGGMGSVPGAVVGGMIIGIAESVSTLFLPTDYRDSIAFAIMVLILLVRPRGLFGQRVRGEA